MANIYKRSTKSLPSHKEHSMALIFSLVLSQTPVYTARPQTWDYCIRQCACS